MEFFYIRDEEQIEGILVRVPPNMRGPREQFIKKQASSMTKIVKRKRGRVGGPKLQL